VAIRVQIRDDREIGAGMPALQRTGDGHPGVFVSMDAADQADGVRVAGADRDDPSPILGVPERQPARRCGALARSRR
jgi:hypothetical protein